MNSHIDQRTNKQKTDRQTNTYIDMNKLIE